MSAGGMRSPRRFGLGARRVHMLAALAGVVALLSTAHPGTIEAKTRKARKTAAPTRTLHKAKRPAGHQKRQSAKRPRKRVRGLAARRGARPQLLSRAERSRVSKSRVVRTKAARRRAVQVASRTPAAKAPRFSRASRRKLRDKPKHAGKAVARSNSRRWQRQARTTRRGHLSQRLARGRHAHRVRLVRRAPDPEKFALPEGDMPPVVDVAAGLLGRPYRFGSDRGAFDCSGFVRRVFAKLGIDLPHSAREQFQLGERVPRDDLEPGDLVFFRTARRLAAHVGIYVGDDKFVHAATGAGQVQVDSLTETYYATHYVGARRIET